MYQQELLFRDLSNPESTDRDSCVNSIIVEGETLETTPVFDAYWYFAFERQNIFKRRLKGQNSLELTDDWILGNHRFTNAYRASDRVSQYLIRNVLWKDEPTYSDEDIFFRALLFKLFNRIDTWEAIKSEFGEIRTRDYNFSLLNEFLSDRKKTGIRNYSAAYIMPSPSRFGYTAKHSNHLKLIEWMLDEKFPNRIKSCSSMSEAYYLLLSAPSIGPFLAYQLVTDLNYSRLSNFSEMEFVVAGPGALDGISKCFVDVKEICADSIIRHMAEQQSTYFELYNMGFENLWGRPLQLIDCQNIFCEISKYSRAAYPSIRGISGRTRIKQKYNPAGRLPMPWYPPNWGINDSIEAEYL